jgi:hypothetical protein
MLKYPYVPSSRRGSPNTSSEAAESMVPFAKSIRAAVHKAIAEAGERGRTGDVVADVLDLSPVQVRARIAELHAAKVVADSGRRELLGSGRRGVFWVLRQFAPPEPDDGQGEMLAA